MSAVNPLQAVECEQATFYRRLGARFIDLVVVGFVLGPLSLLIMYPLYSGVTAEVGAWTSLGLWIVLVLAYDTAMHRLLGKTLGKMALGLRVVDARGKRLGWGPCLLRALTLYVTIIVVALAVIFTATILGWVIVRAMPEHPRLPHDKVAKCFVVREVKSLVAAGVANPAVRGTVVPSVTEKVTMFPELERLHNQGIISEEEYQRKRHEVGL
jgi:uncharacterized RDD family membrane protein YckC